LVISESENTVLKNEAVKLIQTFTELKSTNKSLGQLQDQNT
jgi:hypothetical protein